MPHAHPAEILRLPSESFAAALRELDPASRALLDLSLRRGMRPEEIADLLGADPEAVTVSRDQALEQLANDLGAKSEPDLDHLRARLAELPSEEWTGARAAPPASNGTAAAAPQAERGGADRGRWILLALLALAIVGVIVAIVLAAGGGGGHKASTSRPATRSTPAHAAPAAPGTALAPIGSNGRGAKGTASVANGRLTLGLTGLAAPRGGSYEVWLYNSVIDATPLGSSRSGHVAVSAKLPADWRRFRFIDVSLEPADGNPNHSGESVARVPVASLR